VQATCGEVRGLQCLLGVRAASEGMTSGVAARRGGGGQTSRPVGRRVVTCTDARVASRSKAREGAIHPANARLAATFSKNLT
jgi:hypothetical protein